ncbi:MAG: hypothetical protein JSS44_09045 [Proteobacteria bacterium]|nr:hypothetical protein [Pseudomonadota bacterium]MBS0461753.1 hypothetical protein [Pseudomonadota bacterium]MBS0464677.1 hypothetical protein [Pseudomonadota bacterium]
MTKDLLATFEESPPPFPDGMTWAQIDARARAEGIREALGKAGVIASMAGAEAALSDVPLPEWAQAVIRSQFPLVA